MAKTKNQIAEELITYIVDPSRQPDIDVAEGTVVRDIAIEAPATVLADTSVDVDNAYYMSSLKYPTYMTDDGISQLALNYYVVRGNAAFATGSVRFARVNVPTIDITIPSGTPVQTRTKSTGEVIQFVTTQSVTLTTTTVKDPITRLYFVYAPIIAVVAGASGNVGKNSIAVMNPTITGIDYVTNVLPTTGGIDVESKEALAVRTLTAVNEKDYGTKQGYIDVLKAYSPLITDVSVVTRNDVEMTRNVFGGEIDLYINGSASTAFNYTTNYNPGKSYIWIDKSYRPTLSVSSVTGVTTSRVYTPGVDWQFTKNTSLAYGNSVRAFDAIDWLNGTKPYTGELLSISGQFDSLISGAQSYIDSPSIRFVTADQLVKGLTRKGIQLGINISAFSGYNRTNLQTVIQTSVINAVTQYTAGNPVEQADLVKVIYDASAGVDTIFLPFNILSATGSSGSADVLVGKYEYARVDGITITVL